MTLLASWIEDGTIITVVLAVLVIEIAVLAGIRITSRRGLPLPQLVSNACAGGCLALAARAAIVDDGPLLIGFWLIMGGVAHTTDLVIRLRAAAST